MSEYVCPGCEKAKMAEECWHDAKTWELAEALSLGLPGGPATWGTPVERAWAFIDDAESLTGRVGDSPYAVVMAHPDQASDYTAVGLVNGRYLFVVPDEGEADFVGDFGDRIVFTFAPTDEATS